MIAKRPHSLAAALAVVVGFAGPRLLVAQAARLEPSAWVKFRNATDNAGVVPGNLEVSWTYRGPQTIRGLAVAGGSVVIGTEASDADGSAASSLAPSPGSLAALDVATGRLRWTLETPTWIHGDPLVFRNEVFATFGRLPLELPGGIWAVDLSTGKAIWKYSTAAGVMPGAVLDTSARTVSFAGIDRILYTLDATRGTLKSAWGLLSAVSMSSPSIDDSGFMTIGSTETVTKFVPRTGAIVWKTHLPYQLIQDIPVATGDGLVFTTGTEPIGLKAGWKELAMGEFFSLARRSLKTHPLAAGQLWFEQQWLVALDYERGAILWKRPLGIGLPVSRNSSGTPALSAGRVVVSSPVSRTLFAFDQRTGRLVWQHRLRATHKGAATIVGDDILIGDVSGELTILSLRSGSEIGHCQAPSEFTVLAPIVVGKTLFVATKGGWLMARPYQQVRARAIAVPQGKCFQE